MSIKKQAAAEEHSADGIVIRDTMPKRSQSVPVSHWVNVRDRPGFLHRMMEELAGAARMSLEGDLTRCRFPDDLVIGQEPSGEIERASISPPHPDFVILRLERPGIEPIFKQVLAAGVKRAIWHIQIERAGVLEMGAWDNFHADCVTTGPGISTSLLDDLKSRRVIWDYCVPTDEVGRSPWRRR